MSPPRVLLFVSLVLLGAGFPSPAAAAEDDAPGVPPSIHHYEWVQMATAADEGAPVDESVALSFSTLGRQFEVALEPANLFASGARVMWDDGDTRVEEPPAGVGQFFRGRLIGEPGSWVRLRVDDGELMGIVASGSELYFLEPARHFFGAAAVGRTVAYRLSDTDPLPAGACAAHALDQPAFAGGPAADAGPGGASGATHELAERAEIAAAAGATATVSELAEVGMVADYQYYTRHLGTSAADIAALINAVDGIYEAELGVALQIRNTVVYTSAADPFSDTTDYGALLNEFSTFHEDNAGTPSQILYGSDIAHLMTGRDLSGNVIGVAWMSGLCVSFWGSALSQDFSSDFYVMTLLVAHEMGHNFGAPHDNESGSPCAAEPGTYIMNPVLSSSLLQQFSACSEAQTADDIAAASCFEPYTPGPTRTPTAIFTPTSTPPPTATRTRTATATRTPTSTVTPTFVPLTLAPIASPLVIGAPLTLTGTGFTAGSVMKIFASTAAGAVAYGPYGPTSRTGTSLTFNPVDPSIPLGRGFASVQIVNTDQNYVRSNCQSVLLAGSAALGMPTITAIGGVALRPLDPKVPLATVETVVVQGTTVTIGGTGFTNPLVNLFTGEGNKGPLAPQPGGTSTMIAVVIPADAPTGPGSFQVVNSPYTGNVLSNAVAVPIGSLVSIGSIVQHGTTVTVTGTGFSRLSVINLFAQSGTGGVVNVGGLGSGGAPRVPLTLVDSTRFTFEVPASGVATGAAFVQVLNPPFIPYSSSCTDPDGAFTMIVS